MSPVEKARLLVVLNDPTTCRMICNRMAAEDYDVLCAEHGKAALAILEHENISRQCCCAPQSKTAQPSLNGQGKPIDLMVADWELPDMTGSDLCATIKNSTTLRQTYFILLLPHEGLTDQVMSPEVGADDYLVIPFHLSELLAHLRMGIRIQQLQNVLHSLDHGKSIFQVAATAAHEINNPLTGIFGYLDLLKMSLDSKASVETLNGYIERMSLQAVRIRDIVAKLSALKSVQTKPYLGEQRILDLDTDPTMS
jgi:DNA-binding response OmpR family regulator